jgi:hypothetical protein
VLSHLAAQALLGQHRATPHPEMDMIMQTLHFAFAILGLAPFAWTSWHHWQGNRMAGLDLMALLMALVCAIRIYHVVA